MTAAAIGLAYRHPKPRPTRAPPPRALAVTIARYREDFELRRGPLWDYFAARVPALYASGRPGDRRRSLRTDGADSLLCVIVALLQSMDIRRGFLGRPPLEAGGLWHRRSMLELFGFAFGKAVPGALSPRRMERWLRALKALGILTTHQIRHKAARGGFESKTAIRHVTDRLFELAGTVGQLAKERREAWERVRAQRAALRIENMYLDLRGTEPAPAAPVTRPGAPPAGKVRAGPPRSAAELLGRIRSPQRRS